jgi:Xaa-Pro dipeptidase
MTLGRRSFLGLSASAAGAAALGVRQGDAQQPPARDELPKPIRDLKPMTAGVAPITLDERKARIEKARRLMADNRIDAIVLEGGSSMFYYTGVRWGLSERPFAVVIPQKGELAWVTPKFEEERARELIKLSTDVRAWEEDESPYRLIAGILGDRGAGTGRVGIEERLRFFVFDGLRKELPRAEFVSADPVSAGCRMIKSPAEVALMQRANDITIAAYRAAFATLRDGMPQGELQRNISAAFSALGTSGSAMVAFGKWTAFPHGSITPQRLREGDVVLVDGGTSVDGYQSDITRTTVFGTPTQRQRDVWELEKRAQLAALGAATVGAPCEAVDAAARKVITDAGFGPDYKVPGLPHRTGHGIGLDGHEWTNLVRGNKTPLAPGMCFSDEPMITIYGEFGIRLEDCFHMTESGPKLFTELCPSIDRIFPPARSAD